MDESVKIGDNRQPDGTFGPGNNANPGGRPLDTEEYKLKRLVLKKVIANYQESLAEILPDLPPVLKAKALSGDIQAIKEIHSRVMGDPPKDLNIGQSPDMPFTINIIKDDKGKNS